MARLLEAPDQWSIREPTGKLITRPIISIQQPVAIRAVSWPKREVHTLV